MSTNKNQICMACTNKSTKNISLIIDGIVNDEDIDWDGIEVIVDPNDLNSGIYYVYSYE